jgi:hypothetical protein
MLELLKNKLLLFPAILCAGFLPLMSCASGGSSREAAPQDVLVSSPQKAPAAGAFAPYVEELRIPLWTELPPALTAKESPVMTINLSLIDFAALHAGGAGQLFNDTFYRGLSVRDYVRELVRVQTIEYQEMGEEARHNSSILNSASLNWEYWESLEMPVNGPRLSVIFRDRSFYNGGAHPSSDRTYVVFDKGAAARVLLSDIVREESKPALKELVNRELRAGKKIGPSDSLKKARFLVDEAELTENFFFTPQGLGFHWDPYEIAPYSEGYVEAVVPFEEIMALLSPGGQRLAGDLREK